MADFEITLKSNLSEVLDAARDATRIALEAVGVQAVAHAVNNITANGSVDTGNLRNSLVHEVEEDTVVIGTNVYYAPYIEFGTGIYAESGGGRKTPWVYQGSDGNWYRTYGAQPHPFLRPAIQDNLDEYRDILIEEYEKRMK